MRVSPVWLSPWLVLAFAAQAAAQVDRAACSGPVDETDIQREESPAPRDRARAVIVYGDDGLGVPLDAAERMQVVDAVRARVASMPGVQVVSKAETDAIVREAAAGRIHGRAECAAPMSFVYALEAGRPDAARVRVSLGCAQTSCSLAVSGADTRVMVPTAFAPMYARVERPERVASWLDAVARATPGAREERDQLLLVAFGQADVHVAPYGPLERGVAQRAFDALRPAMEACAPGQRGHLDAWLDVDARGRARLLDPPSAPTADEACRLNVLAGLQLPPANETRRLHVEGWVGPRPPRVTRVAPDGARGVRVAAITIAGVHLELDAARATVEQAVATCDTRRATRAAPLPISLSIELDATGRTARVRARSTERAVDRCVERALAAFGAPCPHAPRGRLEMSICSFPP